jgi:hypothetical protein
MPKLKKVETASSRKTTFSVDISKKACQKLGFKSGNNIIRKATEIEYLVEGAAPSTNPNHKFKVLWLSSQKTKGKVIFIHPWNPDDFSLVR